MTLRLRSIALLLLTTLVAASACEADTGTVVYVTLRGRLAMRDFARLDIVVSNAGGTASQTFPIGADRRLPLSFTVTPTGRTGTLSIQASAFLADGQSAGRGSLEVAIVPDKRVNRDLVLEPDDFLVNKGIPSAQFLVFDEDLAGRQIGVAPDGKFITTFENSCPLDRCDVLARFFDRAARPARNDTSADDGDLIVNQASEYAETPVIAASRSAYMVAWVSRTEARPDSDLKATVLDESGGHVTPFDISVSNAVEDDLRPSVIALVDGSFVVLWERARADTTHELRARLYGADGAPLVNAVTGTADDFRVSALSTGNQVFGHGVGLAGGGFVIVWSGTVGANGNVFARVFARNGTPATLTTDLALTSYTNTKIYAPRVAATRDGFVAGWQANNSNVPALATKPLIVRLFDANGDAVSTEIPVVERTQFFRAAPALAVRPDDGAIGVAWPDCGDLGDPDKSCGIRFRLLRPTGQPLGVAEGVNTTIDSDQLAPTLAAVADDGFVVGWTDRSGKLPDNLESGVRARVIYPALDRHDGQLGAFCESAADAPCAEGLTCQPSADGNDLCHATCTADACPGGGICLNATYCAFQ